MAELILSWLSVIEIDVPATVSLSPQVRLTGDVGVLPTVFPGARLKSSRRFISIPSLSITARVKPDCAPACALLPPVTVSIENSNTSVGSAVLSSVIVTVTVRFALLPAGNVTVCVV